jgi:hypothetical protein
VSREVIIVADGKGGGPVEGAKCRSIVERENHGERERETKEIKGEDRDEDEDEDTGALFQISN